MIEFGKTLRIAREAKGYTTSQVADMTRMLVQVVEGLENENFSRIVAPIYGRGFVKLYCEAVGLDPKPLVEAFMDIYSGNREMEIRERETPSASALAAEPIPAAKTEPVTKPEPAAKPEPVASEPSAKEPTFDFGFNNGTSRYAAPLPLDDKREFRLPAINWRLVILAGGAILVVLAVASGIRALYRATMTAPSAESEETERTEAAPATAAPVEDAKPSSDAGPRKPLALKPFYID